MKFARFKAMLLKGICDVAVCGMLGSVALAAEVKNDSIDDEIAKLKQENELLELQKKNATLKSGGGTDSESNEKSGYVLGVELGFATAKNKTTESNGTTQTQSTFAIPLNVIFGYQYYINEHLGLRLNGFVGYGNYNSKGDETTAAINSPAIHYGAELAMLYDFITRDNTFGIDVGTGYEFSNFINQSIDNATKTTLNNYNTKVYMVRLGVHYVLNNTHQFWLGYKYKGNATSGGSVSDPTNGSGKYLTNQGSPISLTYAYKF